MPQPRPALQRLSAPASLHNGDRESEFEGFKGGKWLKINLTRQLKHGLAFSCLWQLVQVYFRRFWGDLGAEKGLSTGFWSALQRRVSSSASLRLALERHSAIQRLPFACTAAPSVRPAARSAALFASASCTLCIVGLPPPEPPRVAVAPVKKLAAGSAGSTYAQYMKVYATRGRIGALAQMT